VFARVLRLVLFAVVLSRFAGMGCGLVTVPALPLARERGSAHWQRSQAKRNNDCPNKFFHDVISVSFTSNDVSDANRLQPFHFIVETAA
jgi:hypothetical protein